MIQAADAFLAHPPLILLFLVIPAPLRARAPVVFELVFQLAAQECASKRADDSMSFRMAKHSAPDTAGGRTKETALAFLGVVRVCRVFGVAIRVGGVSARRSALSPRLILRRIVCLRLLLPVLRRLVVVLAAIFRLLLAVVEATMLRHTAVRALLLLGVVRLSVAGCWWASVPCRLPIWLLTVSALLPVAALLAVLLVLIVAAVALLLLPVTLAVATLTAVAVAAVGHSGSW